MKEGILQNLQTNAETTRAMPETANDRVKKLELENSRLKQCLRKNLEMNQTWRARALHYQTDNLALLGSRRWRFTELLSGAVRSPGKLIRLPYDLYKLLREKETSADGSAGSIPPARYNRGEIVAAAKKHLSPAFEGNVLVSVIICNRNSADRLRCLFASLKDKTFYRNFEIIVVDNASDDESLSFLETQKKHFSVQIIRNEQNESFSAANNRAAKQAKGEYLLFLNNDTEVTDGWLDEMLRTAQADPQVGAVGAKLVYPEIPDGESNSGRSFYVQHSGIVFRSIVFEGEDFVRPFNRCMQEAVSEEKEEPKQMAAVTAACLLMRKCVFEQIGGFDEHYIYGLEDVDLCLKAHCAGYRNYYCPTAVLFHYEFGTQKKEDAHALYLRRRENAVFFLNRWNEYLRRELRKDKLEYTGCFADAPLTVAFAVTEADNAASAEDCAAAKKLAQALENCGYRIKYLSRSEGEDWYDAGEETDVLIAMHHEYEPLKIFHARADLITAAWVRDGLKDWMRKDWQYTLMFAADESLYKAMREQTDRNVNFLPVADDAKRFIEIIRE